MTRAARVSPAVFGCVKLGIAVDLGTPVPLFFRCTLRLVQLYLCL